MATITMNPSTKNFNTSPLAKIVIVFVIVVLIAIPVAFWKVAHDQNAAFIFYHGNSYSFSYPKSWTLKKTDRDDTGGAEFFLQPPDAAPPETPFVVIDVAPATETAISKLTDSFTIFKYAKTTSTVNGFSAQKFTNVVHASEGVFHSTAYVFQAKGNIYLISLGYKQETPDTELEGEFGQIVATFMPR
jgi:hypothetical protein